MKVRVLGQSIVIAGALLWQSSTFAKAAPQEFDSILIGGALSTCSSMGVRHCRLDSPLPFNEQDKRMHRYALSPEVLEWIKLTLNKNVLAELTALINSVSTHLDVLSTQRSRTDFLQMIDEYAGEDATRALSDAAYYALLDYAEVPQLTRSGTRLKERVSLPHNRSAASTEIIKAIKTQVALKQRVGLVNNNAAQPPLFLFVTASARDNFEAVDFYHSLLTSLHVEARWLPISPALLDAIQAKGADAQACDNLEQFRQRHHQYQRHVVYPELHQIQLKLCLEPVLISQWIKQASGIFFNGGDQSKALAAFINTQGTADYLAPLVNQHKQGKLLIVGTSAGTAVQAGGPVAMISNGTSTQAIKRGAFASAPPSSRALPLDSKDCQDGLSCDVNLHPDALTYCPNGGLGTFSLGVLDTHFSERNREVRLMVLTHDSGAAYGFGIDETTAFMTQLNNDQLNFAVLGQGGVFVVDNANEQISQRRIAKTATGRQVSYKSTTHYFPQGSIGSLSLATQTWNVSAPTNTTHPVTLHPVVDQSTGVWRAHAQGLCGEIINDSNINESNSKEVIFENDGYRVSLHASAESTSFRHSDIGSGSGLCGYVSYTTKVKTAH